MCFDDAFADSVFDHLIVFDVDNSAKVGTVMSLDTLSDGWTSEIVRANGDLCTIELKYALQNNTAFLIDLVDSIALHSDAIDAAELRVY